jgi:cytochrome d ubiquinol oxidase subunit II
MAIAWFTLTFVLFVMYVMLDGYDLGVGILTLFERNRQKKFQMVELVAGIWDANETFLVMLGLALWGGFPLLFGSALQHMYPIVETMIFGLILRGFSVEMISSRGVDTPNRWYFAFGLGSLLATVMMGLAVGSLVNPIMVTNKSIPMGSFASPTMRPSFAVNDSFFGFLSGYSFLFALLLAATFIALGYAYLKFHRVYEDGKKGLFWVGAVVVLLGLSLFFMQGTAAPMNFNQPWRVAGFIGLLLFALVGLSMTVYNFLNHRHTFGAFAYPMAGLLMAFVAVTLALVVTHFPVIVPGLKLTDVTAPDNTYLFLLVGIGLNVPLLTYYTYFAHHVLLKRDRHGVPLADDDLDKGIAEEKKDVKEN